MPRTRKDQAIKPGDKVKFRHGHPWAGEVGSFRELIQTPVGELHVFEVLGKAGLTAGANPNQFSRI